MHFCTAPAATNARLFRSDDAASYPQISATTQKAGRRLRGTGWEADVSHGYDGVSEDFVF